MGHHLYITDISAEAGMTPQKALNAAVGELSEEYGNSVNGASISHVRNRSAVSRSVAVLMSREYEEMSVYTAEVIPVVTANSVTVKHRKHKVVVNAEELALIRGYSNSSHADGELQDTSGIIMDKLASELSDIASITIAALPKAKKAVAAVTEGAAVTVYLVVDAFNRQIVSGNFPTQAAARAAGVELVNSGKAKEASVVARVIRDTGIPALVRITRPEPETATLTVTVTTETVKPKHVVDHYRVAFFYHS